MGQQWQVMVQDEAETHDIADGWNLETGTFTYDPHTDNLHIRLECKGICGDADDDGFPDSHSNFVDPNHIDHPELGSTERIFCRIDNHHDGITWEWWTGVGHSDNSKDQSAGHFRNGAAGVHIGDSMPNSCPEGTNGPNCVGVMGDFPEEGHNFIEWTVTGISNVVGWTGNGFHVLCQSGSNNDDTGEDDMGAEFYCEDRYVIGVNQPQPTQEPQPTQQPTDSPQPTVSPQPMGYCNTVVMCGSSDFAPIDNEAGLCLCNESCTMYGDCCPDARSECGIDDPLVGMPHENCRGHCEDSSAFSDEMFGACQCDISCLTFGDCCPGREDNC